MLKIKIFIGITLFSGVTIGSLNQNYWSCTSVDVEENIFSGWALTQEKAQEQALENCSSYSEISGECVLAKDSCEQIDL